MFLHRQKKGPLIGELQVVPVGPAVTSAVPRSRHGPAAGGIKKADAIMHPSHGADAIMHPSHGFAEPGWSGRVRTAVWNRSNSSRCANFARPFTRGA